MSPSAWWIVIAAIITLVVLVPGIMVVRNMFKFVNALDEADRNKKSGQSQK